jgi:hypothetical protein
MSEDDRPIFPRSSDKSDDARQDLYQGTGQKLGEAEKTFEIRSAGDRLKCISCQADNDLNSIFCRVCGTRLISSENADSPPPLKTVESISPPNLIDNEPEPKTVELPATNPTVKQLTPDNIHTTMHGPAPVGITDALPAARTQPTLKFEKQISLPFGLNYDEWKGRIPWLLIGGVFGFLLAAVIILTLVLLVVAIRW